MGKRVGVCVMPGLNAARVRFLRQILNDLEIL